VCDARELTTDTAVPRSSMKTFSKTEHAAFQINTPRSFLASACFTLSLLTILAISHPGAIMSPDSERYLAAADQFASGDGFGQEFSFWPPLYPMFLSLHHFLRIDFLTYVGWSNFCLLATTLVGFSILLLPNVQLPTYAAAGLLIAAFSQPIGLVYSFVWSETLFLPISLFAVICWTYALREPNRRSYFIWASLFFGLCLLVRHMAVALGISMVISLANASAIARKEKIIRLFIIGLSCMPYTAWLLRTYWLTGTFAGPRSYSGITFEEQVHVVSNTLAHWLFPFFYFETAGIIICALFFGCISGAIYYASRNSDPLQKKINAEDANGGQVTRRFILLYVLVYLLTLLALSRAFSYPSFQFDIARYLSPIYLLLVYLIIISFQNLRISFIACNRNLAAQIVSATGIALFLSWLFAPNRLNEFFINALTSFQS